MVVSIDKITTVRTFEKVQKVWADRLQRDEANLRRGGVAPERLDLLTKEIAFMRATDMAVVISQSQNE